MTSVNNDKMTKQERRNYLFLQAFYLKVKEDISRLERNLKLPDDPEEYNQ